MSFTYSQLKTDVANRLHNKLGRVTSLRDALNSGVRGAIRTPLKTMRRHYTVPTRILDDLFTYTAPSDIQGHKVIDLTPVADTRSKMMQWSNVTPEIFDRLRSQGRPVICVDSNGTSRLLKASFNPDNDARLVVSELDTITDGGTWAAKGSADSLETDTTFFLYGSGSVKFNLTNGTDEGGIDTTLDSTIDLSTYKPDGYVYISTSLPTVTDINGVTIRLGTDSSNYLEMSATADIQNNALVAAWNLISGKLADGTETGTPDYEDINYVAVVIDKEVTATATGVRLDRILVGVGAQHYLKYYSRFGWRSAAGVWMDASTADTDLLNAEEEEYPLIVESCVEQVALAAREYNDADRANIRLLEMKKAYRNDNPDCSLPLESDYWGVPSQVHLTR